MPFRQYFSSLSLFDLISGLVMIVTVANQLFGLGVLVGSLDLNIDDLLHLMHPGLDW